MLVLLARSDDDDDDSDEDDDDNINDKNNNICWVLTIKQLSLLYWKYMILGNRRYYHPCFKDEEFEV